MSAIWIRLDFRLVSSMFPASGRIFVVPVSLFGVLRVAAPRSPWARRFYAPDGHKLARSTERWRRIEARRRRVTDLVAGAPAPSSHDGT